MKHWHSLIFFISLLGQSLAHAQVNLPELGNAVSGIISIQQEYEYGREFLRSIRREAPLLHDPLIEDYIASVSYRLAAKSELTDHRLEFALIDSDILNAFAAPGGIIGINAGLFLYAENEGEFASVLSHELAHLSQRHYARGIEQARINVLPNLATMLGALVIGVIAGGDAGTAALMGSQSIALDNQLSFSRSNEQEADRVGIRTLYNAGFDPADMSGMFEHMMRAKSFSQRLPEFLSTHPLDESRIADSKNRAASYPPVQALQNIEYLLMKQRVTMHYESNYDAAISRLERDLPQLNGQEADAARYGIALAQLETRQNINATETLNLLLTKEPNRITYVMLQADIARNAEDYDAALSILEDNLRINPNNHPLTMAYAQTLIESREFEQAAQVLERHASIKPNDSNLWYELAEVQGLAGNISKVHQARAEYFLSTGELGKARDQLNYALSLENNRLTIARIRQRLDDIRELGNKFYR